MEVSKKLSTEYDPNELEELLPLYYRMLFPSRLFYKWLSYGETDAAGEFGSCLVSQISLLIVYFDNSDFSSRCVKPIMTGKNNKDSYFQRREFSFTLPGDIYIRYQSFKNDIELSKALSQKKPIKIDIGAVFSGNPKDMKKGLIGIKAEHREFIFDIDMTDYDEVRTCCKGADLCKKCWPFLSVAAQILNDCLTKHFGFKNLLWVYSGRRGIHCWVCDEDARSLSIEARSAVADYFTVIDGGQYMSKKVTLDRSANAHNHPLIRQALYRIDHIFDSLIVKDQDLFGNRKKLNEIVSWASGSKLRETIQLEILDAVNMNKPGAEIWKRINAAASRHNRDFKTIEGDVYLMEVKLQLCYPRLDINVTKGLNHLLKAPFCIHPKTGRVCVPFDVKTVDLFNPMKVPIVKDVIQQLDDEKRATTEGDNRLVMKTDMKESILIFEKFVNGLVKERVESRIQEKDSQMEF